MRREDYQHMVHAGLDSWRRVAGVSVTTLVAPDNPHVRVPKIYLPARNESSTQGNVLVTILAAFHLAEYSGPFALLQAERVTSIVDWFRQFTSFVLYPHVNQQGIEYITPDTMATDDQLLRHDPKNGVDYNGSWGLEQDKQPLEVRLVQEDIEHTANRLPWIGAITLHEDSVAPVVSGGHRFGYWWLNGYTDDERGFLNQHLAQEYRHTIVGDHHNTGSVPAGDGYMDGPFAVNYREQATFETWANDHMRVPKTATVEAPFGAPIEQRIEFQLDSLEALIATLLEPHVPR